MKARLLIAKIVFTATLLYVAFLNIDIKTPWTIMLRADPSLLGASVFFYAMTFVIGGIRWHEINKALGCATSLGFCIRIFFVGGFFSQFLIGGGYGGDAYRIWVLAMKTGEKLRSIMSVFIDRASGFAGAIIIVACLFPIYWLVFPKEKQILISISMGCAFVVGILIALAWAGKSSICMVIDGDLGCISRVKEILRGIGEGFLSWPTTGAHLGCSLACLLFNIFAMMAIGGAMGVSIDFWAYLMLGPIVFLAKSFPLSIAGWGVREVATVYFFGFVNIDHANAIAMSMMAGVMVLASSIPGVLLWFINKDCKL